MNGIFKFHYGDGDVVNDFIFFDKKSLFIPTENLNKKEFVYGKMKHIYII